MARFVIDTMENAGYSKGVKHNIVPPGTSPDLVGLEGIGGVPFSSFYLTHQLRRFDACLFFVR